MRYVTVRDLRVRPGEVWKQLDQQGEIILTSHGRPMAIIAQVDEDDVEATLKALRRIRAESAVSRLRRAAAEQGLDRLSEDDIDVEIAQARRDRHAGASIP